MQRFDKNQVMHLLVEVVRKRGEDFVYARRDDEVTGLPTSCTYMNGNEPDCGIGCMLADINVPKPVIQSLDSFTSGSEITSPDVTWLLEQAGFTFTPEALKFMRIFQVWQDAEKPYGQCLDAAKGSVESPY